MDVGDLEIDYSIPVKVILDFFKSQNRIVYIDIPITKEQHHLFLSNLNEIKEKLIIENIRSPKLKGLTIIGKLELDKQNIPSYFAAVKEFNITPQTLVEFLQSKGFYTVNMQASTRLSLEMYNALKEKYELKKNLSKITSRIEEKDSHLSISDDNVNETELFSIQIDDILPKIENINEDVICVLLRGQSGTVELEYLKIELPFKQTLAQLEELCNNSKSTLNDLIKFFIKNPILNQHQVFIHIAKYCPLLFKD